MKKVISIILTAALFSMILRTAETTTFSVLLVLYARLFRGCPVDITLRRMVHTTKMF